MSRSLRWVVAVAVVFGCTFLVPSAAHAVTASTLVKWGAAQLLPADVAQLLPTYDSSERVGFLIRNGYRQAADGSWTLQAASGIPGTAGFQGSALSAADLAVLNGSGPTMVTLPAGSPEGTAGQILLDSGGEAAGLGLTDILAGALGAVDPLALGTLAVAPSSYDPTVQQTVDAECLGAITANHGFPPWSGGDPDSHGLWTQLAPTGSGIGTNPEAYVGAHWPSGSGVVCDPLGEVERLYLPQQVAQEPWQVRFCIEAEVVDGHAKWPNGVYPTGNAGSSWGWASSADLNYMEAACPPATMKQVFGHAYSDNVVGAPPPSGSANSPPINAGTTGGCWLNVGPGGLAASCQMNDPIVQSYGSSPTLWLYDQTAGLQRGLSGLYNSCPSTWTCTVYQGVGSTAQTFPSSTDFICGYLSVPGQGGSIYEMQQCPRNPSIPEQAVTLTISAGDGTTYVPLSSAPPAPVAAPTAATPVATPVYSPSPGPSGSAPDPAPNAPSSAPTSATAGWTPVQIMDWGPFQFLAHGFSGSIDWLGKTLGGVLGAGFGGVVTAVHGATSAVLGVPSAVVSGLGHLLSSLFVPTTTTVAAVTDPMKASFPLSWVTAVGSAADVMRSDVAGGVGGSACGPRVGFDQAGPVPGFHVRFPSPSALHCPGNTADANGGATVQDDTAGDLYGYRTLVRTCLLVVVLLAFAVRVIRAGPWSPGADDLSPHVEA